MLIDTHCHIHEPEAKDVIGQLQRAHSAGVNKVLCVGTSQQSSKQAVKFASLHPEAYAIIGVHPHESKHGYSEIEQLASSKKVVGIGEIGLDYYYSHSPKAVQIAALKAQLDVAAKHNLPVSFHIRDGFDDFWPIIEKYSTIKGVIHSFTDSSENLQKALNRGFYIGLNGISTFTKDEAQKALFDSIPLERILFETDAPFLTPAPYRGKINEPGYVRLIAEYHAKRRGITLEEISKITSKNARALFAI